MEHLQGGLADNCSIKDIAEKHNVPVKDIMLQLAKGVSVEKEHTNDISIAKEVAMDHLFENPRYYTELSNMEANMKKQADVNQNLAAIAFKEEVDDCESVAEVEKLKRELILEAQQGVFMNNESLVNTLVAYADNKLKQLGETRMSKLQLNSSTFIIDKTASEYKELESVLIKIASENKIENVGQVGIVISENEMSINFREASECSKDSKKDDDKKKDKKDEKEKKEDKKSDKEKDEKKDSKKKAHILDDIQIKIAEETPEIDPSKDAENNVKEARNLQLEQKLYQGSLNRTELEEYMKQLQQDITQVRPGSNDAKNIQEQITMVQEQLGAENGLDQLRSDSYSFA